MHLWLAPFTPKGNHFITITFKDYIRIAMIRIWVGTWVSNLQLLWLKEILFVSSYHSANRSYSKEVAILISINLISSSKQLNNIKRRVSCTTTFWGCCPSTCNIKRQICERGGPTRPSTLYPSLLFSCLFLMSNCFSYSTFFACSLLINKLGSL